MVPTWVRDERRRAFVCSDGRFISDEQMMGLDAYAASMLKQVMDESISRPLQKPLDIVSEPK